MSYYPSHGPSSYGQPQPPVPQPPKRNGWKIATLGCGGVLALIMFGGCVAAVSGDDNDMKKTDPPQTTQTTGAQKSDKNSTSKTPKDTGKVKAPASPAQEFKSCVNKNGTAGEKAAVQHVEKVVGTESRNDIFDSAEVYTDFKGGILGKDNGRAKLVAAAFASCYESDNGLVTIYGSDGEMIANGNF